MLSDPRQPGHIQPKTGGGSSRIQLVEQEDVGGVFGSTIGGLLNEAHVVVHQRGRVGLFQLRHTSEVRDEDCGALDPVHDVLERLPGNGLSVVGARPPAKLVNQD